MKNLYLLRHGRAESSSGSSLDISRNLTDIGREEIKQMAKKMNIARKLPQLIICSPSNRTKQTAAVFLDQLDIQNITIIEEHKLYEASLPALLQTINEISESFQNVMMVGHNPSFSDSVQLLTRNILDHLPPSGILHFTFEQQLWSQILPQSGELISLDYPTKKI